MKTELKIFSVDNHKVRTDGDLVNLNDIYALAGSPVTQDPRRWKDTEDAKQLIDKLAENLNVAKNGIYKASRGRHSTGTWAHKLLAVEYAGYLSPELRLKINETFLRAESGDVTLAAEISERASPKDQKWLATRTQGIVARNELTDELSDHGVKGVGFAQCTNATYFGILGGTASEIRKARQLPVKANLRNVLTNDELSAISFAEVVSRKTLEVSPEIIGNQPCAKVCEDSAVKVVSLLPENNLLRKKCPTLTA